MSNNNKEQASSYTHTYTCAQSATGVCGSKASASTSSSTAALQYSSGEHWDITVPPTEADLAKTSHYISDIAALAGALNVNDANLRLLKKDYSKKDSQALQLLKKWKEDNSTASRKQLQELLLGLRMPEAARR